jgi:hypothetical protein
MGTFLIFLVGCVGADPADVGFASAASRGGDDEAPYVASSDGWTLTAHAPVRLGEELVQGSATFERIDGAATRTGGVCLVADLSRKVRCETVADCSGLPVPPGGFLYCAGINGSKHKRCWTRPSNNCTRRPGTLPIQPGETVLTQAVPIRIDGKMVKWISYACLADESFPAGCASADPTQSVIATSLMRDDD